jgi:Ca2+-binding RTX toxin-like protein
VDGGSTDQLGGILNAAEQRRMMLISGDDSANALSGLGGDDSIRGLGGNDTLDGGPGNDTLDGGADNDLVTYANAGGSVTVDLDAGTSFGADGQDNLSNFEGVFGGK